MPRGSPELTRSRMDEIVAACERLFMSGDFEDVTIKGIAECTSFTRPSIYNYFETREEIFLELLRREYEAWSDVLDSRGPSGGIEPVLDFAAAVADTLASREVMLRLLSNNLMEIETNSRIERLTGFKSAYGRSIGSLDRCLERFCPDLREDEREEFVLAFLPMVYGMHPYTTVTDKQREAMDAAGVRYRLLSVRELAFIGARRLLGIGRGPQMTDDDRK